MASPTEAYFAEKYGLNLRRRADPTMDYLRQKYGLESRKGYRIEDYFAQRYGLGRKPRSVAEWTPPYPKGAHVPLMPGELASEPDRWLKGRQTLIKHEAAKLGAVGMWEPPPAPARSWIEKILDPLQAIQYGLSNAAYAITAKKGNAADAANSFQMGLKRGFKNIPGVRTSFKDTFVWLANQHGWEWLKDRPGKLDIVDVIGLAADILGDPLTYVGFGTTGKLSKLSRLGKEATQAQILARAGSKARKMYVAGTLSERALEAAQMGRLAPSMAEQAALGQRALIRFAGHPLVKAPAAFEKVIEPGIKGLKKLPVIRHLGKAFSPTWEISKQMAHGDVQWLKTLKKTKRAGLDMMSGEDISEIINIFKPSRWRSGYDTNLRKAIHVASEYGGDIEAFRKELAEVVGIAPDRMVKELETALQTWEKNPEAVGDAIPKLRKYYNRLWDQLNEKGLVDSFLSDYVPHFYPRNVDLEDVGKIGKIKKFLGKVGILDPADLALYEKSSAKITMQRALPTSVQAIKFGFMPELDGLTAAVKYSRAARLAMSNHGFVKEVLRNWGTRVTWERAQKLIRGIEPGMELYLPRGLVKTLPAQMVKGVDLSEHLVPIEKLSVGLMAKPEVLKQVDLSTREAYILPKALADDINKYFKVVNDDDSMNAVAKLTRKYLNWFKPFVIANPGFHARNWMGAVFNNFLQGITSPAWYSRALKEQAKALQHNIEGKDMPALFKEAYSLGVVKSGIFTKEMSWQADDVKRAHDALKGILSKKGISFFIPISTRNAWIRLNHAMMSVVEDNVRLANYLFHRAKGWGPESAASKVLESQFDYDPQAMTALDRKLRRYYIPFWTWIRNNIPYQLKMLTQKPGKYAIPEKVSGMLERESTETPEEKEYRRPYFEELGAVPLPGGAVSKAAKRSMEIVGKYHPLSVLMREIPGFKETYKKWEKEGWTHGGTIYLNPNFPFQDLRKFGPPRMTEFISTLNPMIKWLINSTIKGATGHTVQWFSGRRLSPSDMDIAPIWMQAIDEAAKKVPEWRQPVNAAWRVLGARHDASGKLKISPIALATLQTWVPPLQTVYRAMPKDPAVQKYYAEHGRAYDQWLTNLMSWTFGIKFILPAVEAEKKARIYRESARVGQLYRRAKELNYL